MKPLRTLLSITAAGLLAYGCAELESFSTKDNPRALPSKSEPAARSDGKAGDRSAAPAVAPAGSGVAAEASSPEGAGLDLERSTRFTRAIPTGDPATSAILVEKLVPEEVLRGMEFEYMVRVTNLTSSVLDGVTVSETPSSNLALISAEPAPLDLAATTVRWDLGLLEPGEVVEIRAKAKAREGELAQSVAEVTYRTGLRSSVAVVMPSLELDLIAPETASPDEELELEFIVRNTGSGTAREVLVTSSLPVGLRTTAGEDSLALQVRDLGPGDSRSMRVTVRAAAEGTYAAAAEASMRRGGSVSSPVRTILVQQAQLNLSVEGPSTAFLGRPARWTFRVKNSGSATAREVEIEHVVPDGLRYVKSDEPATEANGRVHWSLGDIPAGEERHVTAYLQPQAEGRVAVSSRVSATGASDIQASTETTMEGRAALQLEVVDLQDPVLVGDTLTYHIKVYNQGTAAGSNIRVTVELDEGMELVRAQGPTNGENQGSGRITFGTLETLAPDTTATWRVLVRSSTSGDLRLRASLSSDLLTRPVDETESTQFYE